MMPNKFSLPLDRVAISTMLGLVIATILLLWSGDRTLPQVREFNWQDRNIGAEDIAFTLTFNRQIDRSSVEKQLKIQPPLPGKTSWAGSKMAYTLVNPAPYGNDYTVDLQGAREAIGTKRGKEIVPFRGKFRTHDRMFAYIGTGQANRGRLVIYNFKTHKQTILTPANLVVTDFKVDRNSEKLVFTAAAAQTLQNGQPAISSQQIYSVTTGINRRPTDPDYQFIPSGKVELILDNRDYQNVKFDLAPDGRKLVVQRVNTKNPNDFALWVLQLDKQSAPPIKLKQSGDFTISPDSSEVAAAVGQGVSIFPLTADAGTNLDFLPKFGNVLSFAPDGSAAAMVKYNGDYTKSLFVVTNQGTEQEILKTTGSIWDARFAPTKDLIYCLKTDLQTNGIDSREQPYLIAIDLKTKKVIPLMLLPIQQGIQMSLAPDGLALMFDQIDRGESTSQLIQGQGNGIMWLLPIPPNIRELTAAIQPEELPLPGWHPRWLP
jgi:hypothetical protein